MENRLNMNRNVT